MHDNNNNAQPMRYKHVSISVFCSGWWPQRMERWLRFGWAAVAAGCLRRHTVGCCWGQGWGPNIPLGWWGNSILYEIVSLMTMTLLSRSSFCLQRSA